MKVNYDDYFLAVLMFIRTGIRVVHFLRIFLPVFIGKYQLPMYFLQKLIEYLLEKINYFVDLN